MTWRSRRINVNTEDGELTLLRAPAAVAISAFVLGLTVGELAKAVAGEPFASAQYWLAIAVCAPFLLSSRWFGSGWSGLMLRGWILVAAAAGTLRIIYFCAMSYSRRPLGIWIVIVLLDTAVAGALWLAIYALFRRIRTGT
ncbi:MAG: hypothetical protein DMF84_18130 [Acidobacteria bacterium]|nr:MAG: hypothetical protein DMF84_18130 [Acidobacteriota bacterium]